MASAPSISVVVDTFNQAPFIERAVESVFAQDWTGRVEVIVVDDGSTDDTAVRLERFGSRIRVIRQANGGQASALNTGIAAAEGQWIAFLDGDDEWAPTHLRDIFDAAEVADYGSVVWCPAMRIDAEGRELEPDPPNAIYAELLGNAWDDSQYAEGRVAWYPPTSGIAASAVLLRSIGEIPTKYRIAADGWLQMALSLTDVKFGWSHRTVRLRVHGGNAWTARAEHDPTMLAARRALYSELAADLDVLAARFRRRAPGLAHSLRMQALEFEIWEHIVAGRRAEALQLAVGWQPPAWMKGTRQRTFKKAHTLLATVTPVQAYAALRSAWRSSPLAKLLGSAPAAGGTDE
jgi:hypothetical protein